MADWNNQGPFRFMNFREGVPDGLRFWLYIFFLIAFQFSNGFYFSTMAQLSGERALTQEDTQMLGCAVLTGCAFFFPLAFRLKFRFTNKTSLTIAASVLAAVNVIFPHVHSLPILIMLAYIGGFCRLYGTFECFSNLLPKITPTHNYGAFLSFVFFVVIGCVQMFDWAAVKIIYFFDWQHVHIMAIGLCLSVIFVVQTTMRHFRPQPKAPLYGIDLFGMAVWSVFILSAIFVVVYGERFDWLVSYKIRIGIGVSLIALALGLLKMKTDENAFIQPEAFSCPNIWTLLLLFLCFDILLSTQTVLQNTFMGAVMHWEQATEAQLKIPEFLGGLAAALFFWLTRTYLHWRLKLHTFISMSAAVAYCLIMTQLLSPEITMQQLWLPSFLLGFAHVAIFITLTVYAQAYCNFKYYFQVLCILGFVRMGIGDAIGVAIWKHAMAMTSQLQHLTFVGSLRELYGWAVIFGVIVLIGILCHSIERFSPLQTIKQTYHTILNKRKKMKQLAIFLAFVAMSIPAAAQTTYSLDELFSLADQNAKTIRISENAFAAAKTAVADTKSQRLPEIAAQLSIGYNGRGLITDRDFSNPMSIYIPEFANNFSLQVTQVIYAGGAISNSVKLSEIGMQMAELDVKKNRQEVRFYIAGQYLDMMKTLNTMKVIEQNIALTEQLVANMQSRVSQGTALQNDVTRYELQLENLRLQHRKLSDAYSIMNHGLCQMLSLPLDLKILPDERVVAETLETQDEQYWQQQTAIGNNLLQQVTLAGEMAEKKVSLAQSAQLPKLALVAEDHLNGPVTIEIPALNKNFNYWFVGLGLQYNISSLYKSRHDIYRAKIEQSRATDELAYAKEQVNTAVHAAHTGLQTARAELQTCEKQVQLATENYNVVNSRYLAGLALITDMLDASNMKLSAEIAREQARINIIYFQKELEYLRGGL